MAREPRIAFSLYDRDRKNHVLRTFTPGLLNSAFCIDRLRLVARFLDGLEVDHRAPRRPDRLHGGQRVVS
jgi:hypothetical protein